MTSQAKNEIEKLLEKVQTAQVDGETFMKQLMEAQIFMPVHEKYAMGGIQSKNQTQPLAIKDESGVDVLILFTSPERAKNFVQHYPGYGGGLLADFKWVVEKIGAGYAISINPGHELGIDLKPGMIEQMTEH